MVESQGVVRVIVHRQVDGDGRPHVVSRATCWCEPVVIGEDDEVDADTLERVIAGA